MIGTTLWASWALAQTVPSSDLSITSFGFQGLTASSVGPDNLAPGADVDLLLGQRLRWTLGTGGDGPNPVTTRALADARFTVDPSPGYEGDGQAFETHNVRQLGFEFTNDKVTFDLGRHPVFRGGPRLVDGIQALYRPSPTVDVGVWGGLAPSMFDTDFRLRPGGGPIVAFTGSRAQLSVVGEVTMFDGALDRAGVLAMGRVSANRLIEASGRLDMELASADGGPRLSDLYVATLISPSSGFRFDVMYNAFSSYQYVSSADLDPEQLRFAQRVELVATIPGVVPVVDEQLAQDPTVNHLVGGSVRLGGSGDGGGAPRFEIMARHRQHPDEANRYTRIQPTVGAVNLGGRVDLLLNANWLSTGVDPDIALQPLEGPRASQFDVGLTSVIQATDSLALDASVRALSVPSTYDGLGLYADLYIDVVSPRADLLVLSGVSFLSEPDLDQRDGEYGLFLRIAKYLRPRG